MTGPFLLPEVMPEFAAEIRAGLAELASGGSSGAPEVDFPALISQVNDLQIISRCPCGDDFCGSFDTLPRPRRTEKSIPLPGYSVILDVAGGQIAYVEVLFRDEIKARVDALFKRGSP